jgi:hypothetical protein
MKRKLSAAVFLAALTVLAFAASAGAVDGTIEINQAKVMAAGGFPYAISTSGSYRLTGNLTDSNIDADAIVVSANHVTIDLNGFSITGPGTTSFNGVNGFSAGALTVENGTVTGFNSGTAAGVYAGNNCIVRNVHVESNTNGIVAGNNCVIQGCTANSNSNDGINTLGGTAISGNAVDSNSNLGIYCEGTGCLISGNTIDNNGSSGIYSNDGTTGYGANVLNSNGAGVNGPTSLGNNLCSGKSC